MIAKRIVCLVLFFVVVVAFLLLHESPTQVEGTKENAIEEDSSAQEKVAIETLGPVDSLHADVIDEAEAAGLSDDQLQNVRSNTGKIAALARIMNYPIKFYGRVVDLEGNPVINADVNYSAFNSFFEDSEAQTTNSDKEGYFSINDIQGGSLYVRVAKEGYYQIEESKKNFGYAVPGDNPPADNPDNPAIFKLRKHGKAEPLIRYEYSWGIPRDGTPVKVDLIEGKPNRHSKSVSDNEASIIIRAWSPDEKRGPNDQKAPYAWKLEISAPSGGFIDQRGQFNFIAPEMGYTETLTFEMSEGISSWDDWEHDVSKKVFAKLKDGNYARLFLYYRPSTRKSGDTFRVESYTNPSGSRNLEYDPGLNVPAQ